MPFHFVALVQLLTFRILLLRIYVLMHSNALHTFTIYTGKITQVKLDKI
jgi:hypothetical protein